MEPIKIIDWGKVGGEKIYLYTLTNKNGMKVSVSNIGAAIQSVWVKNKTGAFDDVVLGYDTVTGYLADRFYIGTVVGRYANRIAGGRVDIEGNTYQLTIKEGGYHHHGGREGFNKKVWQSVPFVKNEETGVVFHLLSPNGDEGFPGNLAVKVKYTLTDQNQLVIDYYAETDQSTLINLTQHTYFNLAGHNEGCILNHNLVINADKYLPVNQMIVPEGILTDVADTPFDFRKAKQIGKEIDQQHGQLILGDGYDHSWVLKNERSQKLLLAAKVCEPVNGRSLLVYTTEPALHLYTGNFLDGSINGKEQTAYKRREGFCLETQNYPDAPNKPRFPSAILKKGDIYKSRTIFEFGIV
ncbi:aldose 1-epimerase [Mucilaginibacter polytrichastri]|nr:aldose 1-epimerase [Mucilaginibacter polytrichastri]